MKLLSLLAAVLLPASTWAQTATAPETRANLRKLLQEGLFEEEANRNLDAASTAYESLIGAFDKDRQFAATALFRLAEVRAKQKRNDEAVALFQRVLAEFATVEPFAGLSRGRIATLGGTAPPVANDAGQSPEESKEIERLRDLIKNSPDLVDAVSEDTTPLGHAARKGWLKAATFLLDHGANINGPSQGIAPLNLASLDGRKSMVELLLSRGADVNLRRITQDNPPRPAFKGVLPQGTALQAAAEHSRLEVAKALLESGADPNILDFSVAGDAGRSPLHAACFNRNIAMARLLLDHGAEVNLVYLEKEPNPSTHSASSGSPLMAAVFKGELELSRLLLERGANPNLEVGEANSKAGPLRLAVRAANAKLVTLLIDSGADLKSPGVIAGAAEANEPEMVRLLAKRGADLDSKDFAGSAALHYTATRSVELTELLLQSGASPNVRDTYGQTPLLRTISDSFPAPRTGLSVIPEQVETQAQNILKTFELLVAKGADVNTPSQNGFTAFAGALTNDRMPLEIAEWLYKHGADLMAKTTDGRSAIAYATPERRLLFEQRNIFAPWTRLNSITIVVRSPQISSPEPYRVEPLVEFDAPPPLSQLLRNAVGALMKRGDLVPSNIEPILYRAGDEGVTEVARGIYELPQLRWGDILVLYSAAQSYRASAPGTGDYVTRPEVRKIMVKVGDRESVIQMKETGLWWAPTEGMLPTWDISTLVSHLAAAEPLARLGEIKLQRTIDGKTKEWTVDLLPDQPGQMVKPLAARLADGDKVLIPVGTASDPTLANRRRTGLFWAAPGRIFGDRLFVQSDKDSTPRTLAEFIAEAYATSAMVVPNPDLQRIQIHRLKEDGNGEEKIVIDLAKSISAMNGSTTREEAQKGDFPLRWGDVVEILQRKDSSPETWNRLGERTEEFLKVALSRSVTLENRGYEAKPVKLAPPIRPFRWSGGLWEAGTFTGIRTFGVMKVVDVRREKNIAKVRLFSQGTTREFSPEEVERIDPWVLDGDKIEVERL